jgi:RNA polymerase sigma-70 factor (ECF subfamily)
MGQSVSPVPKAARVAALENDASIDIAALYRTHARTVLRWATRLGGPGIDAEDVAQDVFVVAKRRLRTFEGSAQVTAWLFRTTEKIVLAARRKQRLRRWLSLASEVATTSMSAPLPTPGEALERGRDVADVYAVLNRLPERQRRVLILFELEGLSTQEIADLVGAKVATVRVWLFRARASFLEEHQRSSASARKEDES